MARFSVRRARWSGDARVPVEGLTEELSAALPPRFEAAGVALAAGGPSILEACWVAGRDLADLGVPLDESIEELRSTTRLVRDRDPTYDEVRALSVAWGEATLAYLHGVSCSDPLTGLSSLAHLRERVADLYRGGRGDDRRHALVVTQAGAPAGLDPLASSRRLTLLGRAARTVFDGPEPIGRVGPARVVVVAARDAALAPRVSLLRRMVEPHAERVWIERLPRTDDSAAHLLDELARGTGRSL
ncbi:hypothetical protein [Nocardioides sp. CER19]|uniref:hypothetical protein n=1 Tax=Nocardioides sp. CER19 TaxID=3038538 RepID=UPI00244CE1BE|nr:hypothetical protein [Nocardioides sp. CER19]MDH2415333.1 hypothetical protein [Nocardioides sp. CER19]